VKVGDELNLWTVSDGNGFQVLRFTPNFKACYEDVFDQTLRNQPDN
jgi:apolipoprotein N-acyltransferase